MSNVTQMPDQMTAAQISGIEKQIAELRAQKAVLSGDHTFAIGLLLADRRRASGDTAEQAADKMGVKKGVINQIESRGAGLTLDRFVSYCKTYDLDANEMLGIKNA